MPLCRSRFLLASLLALAACKSDPTDTPDDGCRTCHGNLESAAPPKALNGQTDSSDPGVGAHSAHLFGEKLGRAVACRECHLVPDDIESPGHLDSDPPAELTWGELSRAQSANPAWDRNALTCSNTYCHGGTLTGGTRTTPVWNVVDGTQSECDSCHGMPPPAPHPASEACEVCHTGVAGPGQQIANPFRHGDGIIDVVDPSEGCSGCHGSLANSAPPASLDGSGDTSALSVGAHQTHLGGGQSSRPVECQSCHLVPALVDDAGHIDTDAPAELTFAGLAGNDGAQPAWDRNAATCSTTYCHGGTINATPSAPIWNIVDGTQAACGSCHELPPPAPHPANDRCDMCHLPTSGPNQTIANRETHVDGVVQVSLDGCTGCHGTDENLAPPVDTQDRGDTSLMSVGAHQTHLSGGRNSVPVACDACHLVPQNLDDPGHNDTPLPAEVEFKGLSLQDGAMPMLDANSGTCANTYCHGATMIGGTNVDPTWTVVDGSEATCGSCHALPPPAPHPASDQCMLCHAPTAGPAQTIAQRATHIDGIVQATDGTCADCHGSEVNSAPPRDVARNVDTSSRAVGAHRAHTVGALQIARPIACNECHIVPQNLEDPGHVDTEAPAELTWGPIATLNGQSPSYDPQTGSCSNTYCHGATLADGSLNTPGWTIVDGTQAACGTCHGAPPQNNHPNDDRCELCHLPTAGPGLTIADPTTHIDGVLQAEAGTCDSCHGENGVSAPPLNLAGQTSNAEPTIGAHREHLSGGQFSKAVACTECHVVPAELNSPGHVDTAEPAELIFGPIAGFGTSPSWTTPTCNNTYCHSGPDAAAPNPTWNLIDGSQAQCGSCHGAPPNTPAHQGAGECANCHLPTAGPGLTIANRDTHVDGIVQASDADCSSCHGDASSSAPPQDLDEQTAITDPQVGAHRVHITGGTDSKAVACSSCHIVPATLNEGGHVDTPRPAELTFSGVSSLQGSTPVWDPVALTCDTSYCHGGATSGGTNPTPVWNAPGSAPCGSCHGMPPNAPHPQVDDCQLCHAPVAGPNQTIAVPTRHVDGIEDVNEPQNCDVCHGTPQSAAPPPDLGGLNNSPRVGAHTAHLQGTGDSLAVPCFECHVEVNPATLNQAGHYDTTAPAEVRFGPLGRLGGAPASLNGQRCDNTYCHGETLLGGTTKNPTWTDGNQACDACHGMPPPDANHGNGSATNCEGCHPDTAGPNQTIVDASRHVDGVIDTSAACDACHGGGGDPSPPLDLAGLNTSPQVGAHQAHLGPQNAAPVACSACHIVPAQYGDPGHADTPTPAEVTWAGIALTDGANPSYNALQCNNTYCHGTNLAGGQPSVTWDDADGSESQCGACHGMPPPDAAHASVGDPNSCNTCHEDSAGANQAIIDPALHIDGIVQVSGGSCDSCHGSPPSPGNESYPGSAGAHMTHAGALGFECTMCHGNNGAGPDHGEGGNTVQRQNVDLVFDATVSFPGGTSMENGQASVVYQANNMRCGVGCHNPRVGNPAESPNLNVLIDWGGGSPGCAGCHDSVATAPPQNHDIGGLGDAGCLECHDQSAHTQGATLIRDPDPNDGFTYSPGNVDGLCKTCHDSSNTYFGQTTPNVTPFWTVSSHGAEGFQCSDCHTYHGSTNGPVMVDRANATCMASGCHDDLTAVFNQVPGGPNSHHRIEGGPGVQLMCVNCHNPHLDQPPPNAQIDPDNKWSTYAIPTIARTNRISNGGNFRGFCLSCHDSSPPPGVQGALNIAAALANDNNEPTQFKKEGQEGLHRKKHNAWNCQSCHESHGSPGTPGINRGRMLMNYMTINQFSQNQNYNGENSCGTNTNGLNFGCHGN